MKIRTKLAFGFGTVAILLAAVGGICLVNGSSVREASIIVNEYGQLRVTVTEREVDHLKWCQTLQRQIMSNAKKITVQTDPTKCALGKWIESPEYKNLCKFDPEFKKISETIIDPHAKLHASATQISSCWQTIHPGLLQTLYKRLDDHRCWALAVCKELNQQQKITAQADPTKCAFGKWLQSDSCSELENEWPEFSNVLSHVKVEHASLHATVSQINSLSDPAKRLEAFNQETDMHLQKVAEDFDKIIQMEATRNQSQLTALSVFEKNTLPLLAQTQKIFSEVNQYGRTAATEQNAQQAKILDQQKLWVTIGMVAGFIIASIVGTCISVSLWRRTSALVTTIQQMAAGDFTAEADVGSQDEIGQMALSLNHMCRGLRKVIGEIRMAADQTASSSEELSSTAQSLSSGAQNQAASIEQMSASVAELTSSISQVAQNAKQADQVCRNTTRIAENGGECVGNSIEGMEEIKDSSTQIANIINVIRQIASQTNLLALNAAIEAASAGEHGLGFAVVAEEVRKLAERSGKAADEITQLIEESGKRVDSGTKLSAEVGSSIETILKGIQETASGMASIASGTNQQADTAQQVSDAIDNISTITEENSASAEEMAASAEELSAQAQQMLTLVERFKVD